MVKKTFFFFLAAAAIFTACKKNDTTVTKTTAQKVLGKWAVASQVSVEYSAGVGTTYTSPYSAADYSDFRADGKAYLFYEGSYDTASYSIINDQSIKFRNDTAQIRTLTDNSFVLFMKEYYGRDSSTVTISLKK